MFRRFWRYVVLGLPLDECAKCGRHTTRSDYRTSPDGVLRCYECRDAAVKAWGTWMALRVRDPLAIKKAEMYGNHGSVGLNDALIRTFMRLGMAEELQ